MGVGVGGLLAAIERRREGKRGRERGLTFFFTVAFSLCLSSLSISSKRKTD